MFDGGNTRSQIDDLSPNAPSSLAYEAGLAKMSRQIQLRLSEILGGPPHSYNNWSGAIADLSRDVDEKVRDMAHRIRIVEVQRKRRTLERKWQTSRRSQRTKSNEIEISGDFTSPKRLYASQPDVKNAFRAVIKEFQSHRASKAVRKMPDFTRNHDRPERRRRTYEENSSLYDYSDDKYPHEPGFQDCLSAEDGRHRKSDYDEIRRSPAVVMPRASTPVKRLISQPQRVEIGEDTHSESESTIIEPPRDITKPAIESDAVQTPAVCESPPVLSVTPSIDDGAPIIPAAVISDTHENIGLTARSVVENIQRRFQQTFMEPEENVGEQAGPRPVSFWRSLIGNGPSNAAAANKLVDSSRETVVQMTTDASSTEMKETRIESDIYETEPFKGPQTLTSSKSLPKFALPEEVGPLTTESKHVESPHVMPKFRGANLTPMTYTHHGSLRRVSGTCSQSDLKGYTGEPSGGSPMVPSGYYPFPAPPQMWVGPWQQFVSPEMVMAHTAYRPPMQQPYGMMPQWVPNAGRQVGQHSIARTETPSPPMKNPTPPSPAPRRSTSRAPRCMPPLMTGPGPRGRMTTATHVKRHESGVARSGHVRKSSWTEAMLQDVMALPGLFSTCSQFGR